MAERSLPEIRPGRSGGGSRNGSGNLASAGTVGAMIRASREALGLSQHRVADLTAERGIPVSRSAICDIERDRNLPAIESLVSLCDVLQLDPREILERVIALRGVAAGLRNGSIEELLHRSSLLFWNGQCRAAATVYAALGEQLELDTSLHPVERRRMRANVEMARAAALQRCGNPRAVESIAMRGLHLAAHDDDIQVGALVVLAELHGQEGLLRLAEAEGDQALRLAQAEGSPRLVSYAWSAKGSTSYYAARFEEAIKMYSHARECRIQAADNRGLSRSEGCLGACFADLGHPRAARRKYRAALGLARQNGDRGGEAIWLIELGRVALTMDDPGEADRCAWAGLRIARANDNPFTLFCGIWLQHRIAQRRNSRDPDRHRIAYLTRLYTRVANRKASDVVREFRREILGLEEA